MSHVITSHVHTRPRLRKSLGAGRVCTQLGTTVLLLVTASIGWTSIPIHAAQEGAGILDILGTPVLVPRVSMQGYGSTTVLPVPASGTGPGTTFSTINVAGPDAALPILRVRVALHIAHTNDADLAIYLTSPSGVTVELSSLNGGDGDNYGRGCAIGQHTEFDDAASTPISTGVAPFDDAFQPEQPLSRFRGATAAGTWTLRIDDTAAGNSGSLQCWLLEIETGLLPKMIGLERNENTLLRFDSAAPGTIEASVPITGLLAGETMRAIDFRPADHALYGIASNAAGDQVRLYTLDPVTGAASAFPALITGLTPGTYWAMSFHPYIDEIRLVNDLDENLRVNPNDGSRLDTTVNDTNLNPASVIIDSVAYHPSAGGGFPTLYALNSATYTLVRIGGIDGTPSPNGGSVTNVGPLGLLWLGNGTALDSSPDGSLYGVISSFLTSACSLYRIDTATGAGTLVGAIGDGTRRIESLAVVPPLTDVQLTIVDSPDPVIVGGGNITYSLSVTNAGAEPALNVAVRAYINLGMSFVSLAVPPGWITFVPPVGSPGISAAGTLGLGVGETATLTLVVQPDDETPIGSLIELQANLSSEFESESTNNYATAQTTAITTPTSTDLDGDMLPDEWERRFGLSDSSATLPSEGPLGDADHDGISNADELVAGTHPRGFVTRYFAEGATSEFFDTSIAILNTSATSSGKTLLRHLRADGTTVSQFVEIPILTRSTIDPESVFGAVSTEFGTVIEADTIFVADRTMRWDGNGYGSHAERAIDGPERTWYLAEGATHSGFNLFYLIQNANPSATSVQVTYLLPAPNPPIVKDYVVGANSRFNIWVNREGPALASTDVSAIVTASQPVIVERAMYLNSSGLLFGAGHESAGVTSPSLSWFLAEGATGDFFDLFVLIANPNPADSAITATYLLADGSTVVKNYVVDANSRSTIWVDLEDPLLAAAAVSTTIESTNGVPVIVERAMWWPGSSSTWFETHNSAGSRGTEPVWGLAEGEQGGPFSYETYILIANTSPTPGSVDVTLYFEDSTSVARTFPLNPNSRFNVAVGIDFPEAIGRRFGAIVQSTGSPPAQIVVERAIYSNAFGIVWAAGSNALGTPLFGEGPGGPGLPQRVP